VTPLSEGWHGAGPLGVTPDGSRIVFFVDTGSHGGATHAGDLYVINADGSGLRQLNPKGAKLEDVGMPVASLSPDGRQAAFGVDNGVWVVDLEGGAATAITPRTASLGRGGHRRAVADVHAVPWSRRGRIRPDGTDDTRSRPRSKPTRRTPPCGRRRGTACAGYDSTLDGPPPWIMDPEGRWIGQVTHEPSNYSTYSWAPAG
jgi:hypothetical protein